MATLCKAIYDSVHNKETENHLNWDFDFWPDTWILFVVDLAKFLGEIEKKKTY